MKAMYEEFRDFIYNNKDIQGFHRYNKEDIPNFPQRVNRSLEIVNPTAIFIFNNKPLVLFFDQTKKNKEKIFKNCWNFAEAPIVIIENESDYELYNGFDYILENGTFLLKRLSKDNEPDYISIISGQYFKDFQELFDKKDNRVDKTLLKNIKNAREKLIIELGSNSLKEKLIQLSKTKDKKKRTKIFKSFSEDEKELLKKKQSIANALLGRVILIRYLIDREVALNFEGVHKPLTKNDFKEILTSHERTYNLFKYLKTKDGFNGDWFPIEEDEETLVKAKHLNILKELISGTDIKTGQMTLFDIYDFSIIPIEFISNIYESFIGEENQKDSGAYYTPTFLVDYILKYTIDEYFKQNPDEYNCKVLDPACGSGIFLVETLRKLIKQYEIVTNKSITPEQIIKLVKDNIYGIDYNKDALQISVFSLYLTMLDYQKPRDIEEFTFPYLLDSKNNPDTPNFFENDFFDTEAKYNNILKKENINFIIGNPPYGKSTIKEDSYCNKYIKDNKIIVANRDVVQPFMVRVKDLVNKGTKVSFIVTSKVLYNLQTKNFRTKQFFNQFKVNHILELSSVRKEIFENANVPISIIFYEYSTKDEVLKNNINYISMKPSPYFEKLKILLLSKSDFKKVNQAKLLEYDYLWKILVYGSYLDFNFIKRLKETSIYDIAVKKNYPKGMGIQATKGQSEIPEHIGKKFIEVPRGKRSDKYMNSFYIASELPKWTIEKVHRRGKSELFKKYSVLIRRGVNPETFRAKSAILYEEAVFKHTLTGINVPTKNEARNFIGLINSSLFTYFNLEVASSFGIEREQLHDDEKLQAPYIKDKKIVAIVSKIEKLKKDYFEKNKEILISGQEESLFKEKEKSLIEDLDNRVLDAFNLTKQEYALVDYANSIVIPWITKRNAHIVFEQLKYKDKRVENYIEIFIKHYTNIYKEINMYFGAEILWDEYAIGIYFKVLDKKPKSQIVWKKEKNIQNFLKLSSGKTLENLFIQKDIKGFESDGFYVIKPNEYKNWHEAIGYLDFYEFRDAILKAGK